MSKYLLSTIMIALLSGCSVADKTSYVNTPSKVYPKIHTIPILFRPANLDRIGATLGSPVYIRIFKAEKILELWIKVRGKYLLLNTYPILKTSGELGPKTYEGDRQNPEGSYFVTKGRLNRFSKYHLAINIGYPNSLERYLGYTGSNIMIHGNRKSIGCFAMGDAGIEDIYPIAYTALDLGQKSIQVAIYPFIMNTQHMREYQEHPWYPLWEDLKKGYDLFEKSHIPPLVKMKEGRYLFYPGKS